MASTVTAIRTPLDPNMTLLRLHLCSRSRLRHSAPLALFPVAPAALRAFCPLRSACARGALLRIGGVEGGGETCLLVEVARAVPEARPSDPGRAMAADDAALIVLALDVVEEDVLGDDHVA